MLKDSINLKTSKHSLDQCYDKAVIDLYIKVCIKGLATLNYERLSTYNTYKKYNTFNYPCEKYQFYSY